MAIDQEKSNQESNLYGYKLGTKYNEIYSKIKLSPIFECARTRIQAGMDAQLTKNERKSGLML